MLARCSEHFSTVVLLSLDLAESFTSELQLGDVLSTSVQECARQSIDEALKSASGDVEIFEEIYAVFLERASKDLSPGTRREIRLWQKRAFPGHAEFSRRWLWSVLLTRLCFTWDGDEPHEHVPLDGRQMVWARLQARTYLAHVECVRREAERTHDRYGSDWDGHIERLYQDFFSIVGTLAQVAHTLEAGTFWASLLSALPRSDIQDIQGWGRRVARKENMPLRYADLPRGRP